MDDERDRSSRLPGFYRLSVPERQSILAERCDLSLSELAALAGDVGLTMAQAERMSENVVGRLALPLGVCVNLRVDRRDRFVPMAIEEPSVVAAASHAAKLLRACGGVRTERTPPVMIGQVQLLDVPDHEAAAAAIHAARGSLLEEAASLDPVLVVGAGGGPRDLEVRWLPPSEDDPVGPMLVVHVLVDVRDAMGANAVNTICEGLAPTLERLTGGRARLRILSNLADRRLVVARGEVPIAQFAAKEAAALALTRGIEEASAFAERDPYRAATHNKGILNGIDAALVAFGQDWRAVEAGAHAFAARGGRYTALSRWRLRGDRLAGRLELPLAVGVIGGVVRVHPTVRAALRIAAVTDAGDLASLVASVGLAQNLAALRALAGEGIQHGHMRLHARNVASEAGARGAEVAAIAAAIADAGTVTRAAAQAALRRARAPRQEQPRPLSEDAEGQRQGEGRAVAKAILLGEHFVVHGSRAIALPLPTLQIEVALSRARAPAPPGLSGDALAYLRVCVERCHAQLGGPDPREISVEVSSTIPVSAGLGASAAAAVACARAWCAICGLPPSDDRVVPIADACEEWAHGSASGVDVRAVLSPTPLSFRRGEAPRRLDVAPGIALLLVDTGSRCRTAQMVAQVAEQAKADGDRFHRLCDRADDATGQAAQALAAGDAEGLGAILDESQSLLAELALSTDAIDHHLAQLRRCGAVGGKLTGSGGGGCVVGVCRPEALPTVRARLEKEGTTLLAAFSLGETHD